MKMNICVFIPQQEYFLHSACALGLSADMLRSMYCKKHARTCCTSLSCRVLSFLNACSAGRKMRTTCAVLRAMCNGKPQKRCR